MNWKQKHANDSEAALRHALVVDVISEQLGNICGHGKPPDALVKYGLTKIASVAAQVARAQALGFDPDLLRLSPDEANAHLLKLAQAAVEQGVPTTVIVAKN